MKVSKELFNELVGKTAESKQNKYKNIKIEYNGMIFDSKKEYAEYLKLIALQDLGVIRNLKRQVEYELIPKFVLNGKTHRKTTYKCDFSYVSVSDNKIHVVDVKSPITAKNEVYKLKKKMMAYKYGIEIEEI